MANALQALGISPPSNQVATYYFVQTAAYGPAIPIAYGLARVAGTVMHLPAQPTLASSSKSLSSKSGKGGGAASYTAPVIIGLCEGPIQAGGGGSPNAKIGLVWESKNAAIDFATGGVIGEYTEQDTVPGSPYHVTLHPNINAHATYRTDLGVFDATAGVWLTAVGSSPGTNQYVAGDLSGAAYVFNSGQSGHVVYIAFSFITTSSSVSTDFPSTWITRLGTRQTQTVWSYLASNFPAQAVDYPGVAFVANPTAPFPNSSMPQYSWEVYALDPFNAGAGIYDANGADILTDFLTDAIHGAGLAAASLGDLTAYQAYGAAYGLFSSPVYDAQKPAREHLAELFEVTNSAPYWSDGLLKVVPYGDQSKTANGFVFTANSTPLYSLTDDDFLQNRAAVGADGQGGDNASLDPIVVTRRDPATIYNSLKVEYENRAFDYNSDSYTAENLPQQILRGPIPAPPLQLRSIKTAAIAQQVAQLRLQREIFISPTAYSFVLGWKYSLVEPTDLLEITDAEQGLNATPVRVTSVDELPDEEGFAMTAEPWPFGAATAVAYASASGSGTRPNTNVTPGDTDTPVIIEGPVALLTDPMELWVGARGTGPHWGGCQVWISTDNTNFEMVGTIQGAAVYGSLTANLTTNSPQYPSVDSVGTLSVDVGSGTLDTQSSQQFDALKPLCYVGGMSDTEWLCYETATLTGAGLYDLTNMYRGLYLTQPQTHSSGDLFMFCDDRVARIRWPGGKSGDTVYFKLPAFNSFGAAQQDVASVSSFSYVIGSDAVSRSQAALTYSAASFGPSNQPAPTPAYDFNAGDGSLEITGGLGALANAGFVASPSIQNGLNATSFNVSVYQDATAGAGALITATLYRITGTTLTNLGTASTLLTTGWQTLTPFAGRESTAGNTYQVVVLLVGGVPNSAAGAQRIGSITIQTTHT